MTVSNIKTALLEACLNGDAELFIDFLQSDLVETNMPNKMRFYRFFKRMIKDSQENTIGGLNLRIEDADWLEKDGRQIYCSYDQMHKYPRLTLIVKETTNRIYIETMPF
ncbi:hypothetical protein CAP47_07075 [Psychroflexus sp. S27]|uniref:hypothetical protein n=1 Tax=Psychroflexus sp. S27 TaxID=1982757 RepID=UPI000C2A0C0D|nr:hypothetical protein [Psychroflexus sp. S27]PJX22781.1 hypothetical protein CAP47_07075 [Psychroflexus sp. S27]